MCSNRPIRKALRQQCWYILPYAENITFNLISEEMAVVLSFLELDGVTYPRVKQLTLTSSIVAKIDLMFAIHAFFPQVLCVSMATDEVELDWRQQYNLIGTEVFGTVWHPL
jgi:hypothetical protein